MTSERRGLGIFAEVLARAHGAEEGGLLGCSGRRDHRRRDTRGLGRQPDVTPVAGEPVVTLEIELQLQLGRDDGNDAHPGDEPEVVHILEAVGIEHRDLHPARTVPEKRHRHELRGGVGSEELEGGLRRSFELLGGRDRDPMLVTERGREHLELEVAELDQIGPEPAAVDHLRLEAVVQLLGRDEVPLDEEFAESNGHGAFGF